MSIKHTIAHGMTPHGWMHIWHESDVDSLDEIGPREDIYIQIAFGRTETTHRIPMGLWRIIARQVTPNAKD